MEKACKIVTKCLLFFAAALCLLACSDIEPVTEADGITDTAADSVTDPCEGIDCGGNGRCLVAGGDTAVCMCDTGYHAEGLECIENVPGEECSGVDCSGHGTCVVVRDDPDYPVCICDEGYHNEGDTNCVPDEGGITCGAGTHPEGGVCVPDDDTTPEEFCVPELRNPPGFFTVARCRESVTSASLVWTGEKFLIAYVDRSDFIYTLKSVTVSPDGSVGETNTLADLGDGDDYPFKSISMAFTDSTAALLYCYMSLDFLESKHTLYLLDPDGNTLSLLELGDGDYKGVIIRIGDRFALVNGKSMKYVNIDGTFGDIMELAPEDSYGLSLASYGGDRIGYIYSSSSDNLCYMGVSSLDGAPVTGPTAFFPADSDCEARQIISYKDGFAVYARVDSYPYLKLFNPDGSPRTSATSLSNGIETGYHLVWTGHYFSLHMLIIDSNGNLFTDELGRPIILERPPFVSGSQSMFFFNGSSAAFHETGVAIISEYKERPFADAELKLFTYECL